MECELPDWVAAILVTLGQGAVPEMKDDLESLNQKQRRPDRRAT